jgi:hypothetical protein
MVGLACMETAWMATRDGRQHRRGGLGGRWGRRLGACRLGGQRVGYGHAEMWRVGRQRVVGVVRWRGGARGCPADTEVGASTGAWRGWGRDGRAGMKAGARRRARVEAGWDARGSAREAGVAAVWRWGERVHGEGATARGTGGSGEGAAGV